MNCNGNMLTMYFLMNDQTLNQNGRHSELFQFAKSEHCENCENVDFSKELQKFNFKKRFTQMKKERRENEAHFVALKC